MSTPALNLIREGFVARRENCPADAHRLFSDAVTAARASGARRDLIQALAGLGQIDRDEGDGDAALPLYEEAVALCREEGNPLALAHTVRHLGDIHQDAGRLEEAEPCYAEALALYRANASEASALDVANAVRPYAILKGAVGERAAATNLWEEARDLYAEVGIQAGVDEGEAHLAALRLGSD
jgi:tetratricopeptide (TPR) repeat protein